MKAKVDTHPKGGDAKQAPCASMGSAVPERHSPKASPPPSEMIEKVARALAVDQAKRHYGIDRGADEAWEALTDYHREERLADARAAIEALNVGELIGALRGAKGYLMNAKIDLQTGAPKATAIRTIEGGITRIDKALESIRDGRDK